MLGTLAQWISLEMKKRCIEVEGRKGRGVGREHLFYFHTDGPTMYKLYNVHSFHAINSDYSCVAFKYQDADSEYQKEPFKIKPKI